MIGWVGDGDWARGRQGVGGGLGATRHQPNGMDIVSARGGEERGGEVLSPRCSSMLQRGEGKSPTPFLLQC